MVLAATCSCAHSESNYLYYVQLDNEFAVREKLKSI